MTILHLMVGLPCSGKSTRAKQLEAELGALRLTPDEWHIDLFGDDVADPDHDRRHDAVEVLMWRVASVALKKGVDVILDFGFWARIEREDFAARAAALGATTKVHFMDVPRDELLARSSIAFNHARSAASSLGTAPAKSTSSLSRASLALNNRMAAGLR